MTIVRLALRLGWRGGLRPLVFPLVAFVPFLLVMTGITAANALTNTQAENVAASRSSVADFAVSDNSGAPLVDRASAERMSHKAGAIAQPVGFLVQSQLVVRSDSGIDVARYFEETWGRPESEPLYRVVQGRLPVRPREVALTVPLARKLNVAPGDTVELAVSRVPVHVVGIAEYRTAHATPLLLAGPGTWWSIPAVPTEYQSTNVFLVVERQDELKVSQALGAPAVAPDYHLGASTPFYITQSLLVLLPVILAVASALGALVLVRFRRLGSDLAIASALGLTDDRVRSLAVLTHLGTVAPAVALGAMAGVPIGSWVSPWAAAAADRDVAPHGLPLWELLVVVLVGIGITAIITALISARLVRELRAGAAGRPASDSISVATLRWWPYVVVGVAGIILMWIGWSGRSPDPKSRNSTTSLMFTAGVLLACAAVAVAAMGRAGQLLGRLPVALRFPILQASRDRGRSAAVVLVAMTAIAIPFSILINQASYQRIAVVSFHPSMPPGQINITPTGGELTATQIKELSDAAGARVVSLNALGRPRADGKPGDWWNLDMADPNSPYRSIRVIEQIGDLTAVSGYQPTAGDVAALRAGQVLAFADNVAHPSQITLLAADPVQNITRPITVHQAEAPVNSFAIAAFTAVVLREALQPGGDLQPVYGSWRILGGAERIDAVRAVGAGLGIPANTIVIDEPFPFPDNPEADLTLAVTLPFAGLLLMTLSAGILRERSRDLQLMAALGSRSRTVRVTALLLVNWPLLWGAIAGVIAGIAAGVVSFLPVMLQRDDATVVVPFSALALTVAGAVAVVCLVALAKTRKLAPFVAGG